MRSSLLAVVLVSAMAAGCDDGAKKSVAARVPALQSDTAQPQTAQSATAKANSTSSSSTGAQTLPSLPLWTGGNPPPISLLQSNQDNKSALIARVEAKFASRRAELQGRPSRRRPPRLQRCRGLAARKRLRPQCRPQAQRAVPSCRRHGLHLRVAGVPAGDGFQETRRYPPPSTKSPK